MRDGFGRVRTGLMLQRSVDQPLFGNLGVERTLGDQPLRATGYRVFLLLDVIQSAPFTDCLFAPGDVLGNQVIIGLCDRQKGREPVRSGFW